MINDLTKEGLERLGIYELRSVARQVGVYSPTLYKKDVLIEKVLSIISGEEQPYIKKTNQGRPAKQIAGLDEIMNIFVHEVDPNSCYGSEFRKESIFSSSSLMQPFSTNPENFEDFQGFVRVLKENYAVVYKNGYFEKNTTTYYITSQMLMQAKLKDGDYITGKYYYISDDKPQLVQVIKTINGATIVDNIGKERMDFTKLEAYYPTKRISVYNKFDNFVDFRIIDKLFPIGEGSRVCFSYDNKMEIDGFIIDLVHAIVKNSEYDVTLIACDERPEDISYIKNECSELKVVNKNNIERDEQFVDLLRTIFDNVIRNVEIDKSEVLIIKNVQKLISLVARFYEIKYKQNEVEARINALEKIKNCSLLAKNTNSEKALTIIGFNCPDDIKELCNTSISLKDEDIRIDVFNSNCVRPRFMLSQKENENLKFFMDNLSLENYRTLLEKVL